MGPLSSLSTLYGTGDCMIMWALAETMKAATEMIDRIDMLMMGIFRSCND
jgi:hypothetical protein